MPRISAFRKKGSRGAGGGAGDDEDEQDDSMTITSGWSIGNSSVSDRIMGRMKKNLTFANKGGGEQQNFSSASSVGSRSVGSRRSTGRFGGRRGKNTNDNMMMYSGHSVDGGRGRSESAPRFRPSGGSASSVGVNAMEEMDSSEAMALKGKSMGRRSTRSISTPPARMNISPPRRFSQRSQFGHQRSQRSMRSLGDSSAHEPVEYSLAELRSMNESELEQVMHKAGVPAKDIANTLNDASQIDASIDTVAEDQRKNSLVALFVNSGHVKLVAKDTNLTMERRTTMSSLSAAGSQRTLLTEGSRRKLSPIKVEQETVRVSFPSSEVSMDERSFKSSNTAKDKLSKKSKLEKIAELKTENSSMKRENKSLKKTVKKLLGQLTTAIQEKDELQQTISEGGKEREQKEEESDEVQLSSSRHSLHSIDETNDATKGDVKTPQDANNDDEPPYDVLAHGSRDDESVSVKSGSLVSMKSSAATKKDIVYLKRKLKKEKEAHQNTEFRLKAELDILAKEVDGLQRELGLTLESLDSAKKRARESRESASSLKHQLRSSSAKVKELTAEAEARDKLIETFTKILLQRVGVEDGGGGGDGNNMLSMLSNHNLKGLDEEKMGDEMPSDEGEESYAALKVL